MVGLGRGEIGGDLRGRRRFMRGVGRNREGDGLFSSAGGFRCGDDFGVEADGGFLRGGGIVGPPLPTLLHELADGVEDESETFIVLGEFLLEGFEFSAEVFVGGEELAKADEGADDFDADADGGGAAEDGGEHGDALLGEGVGAVLGMFAVRQS